jgi:hypothetical protein
VRVEEHGMGIARSVGVGAARSVRVGTARSVTAGIAVAGHGEGSRRREETLVVSPSVVWGILGVTGGSSS